MAQHFTATCMQRWNKCSLIADQNDSNKTLYTKNTTWWMPTAFLGIFTEKQHSFTCWHFQGTGNVLKKFDTAEDVIRLKIYMYMYRMANNEFGFCFCLFQASS